MPAATSSAVAMDKLVSSIHSTGSSPGGGAISRTRTTLTVSGGNLRSRRYGGGGGNRGRRAPRRPPRRARVVLEKDLFGPHESSDHQPRRCRVFCVVLQRAIAGGPHDP